MAPTRRSRASPTSPRSSRTTAGPGSSSTLSIDESAADLDGPVGVAVHRVAREGLANVARHAPGNRVELRVDSVDDGVRLVVVDHGRPAAPADPQALHFGLVGMAERTRALGGRFDAGPTADGWRLEARFPSDAAARDRVASP